MSLWPPPCAYLVSDLNQPIDGYLILLQACFCSVWKLNMKYQFSLNKTQKGRERRKKKTAQNKVVLTGLMNRDMSELMTRTLTHRCYRKLITQSFFCSKQVELPDLCGAGEGQL